jgi:hypothetical protein
MSARPSRSLGVIVVVALAAGACTGDPRLESEAMRDALAGFSGSAIEAHMQVLAADRMEGRGTGSQGHLRAA